MEARDGRVGRKRKRLPRRLSLELPVTGRTHLLFDHCCGRGGTLVLPDSNDSPTPLGESAFIATIASHRGVELRTPPFSVCLRQIPVVRTGMPEAPIDIDGDTRAAED